MGEKVCQVLTHYEYVDIELIENAIEQINESFPSSVQYIEVRKIEKCNGNFFDIFLVFLSFSGFMYKIIEPKF